MCNFCGSDDGCTQTNGLITVYPLTADDWNDLYKFMKYSYLPFVHSVIMRAQRRAGIVYTPKGRPKRILNPKMKEMK